MTTTALEHDPWVPVRAAPRSFEGVVLDNERVASDAGVLRFRIDGAPPAFGPGQFVQLRGWGACDPILGRPFSLLDQGASTSRPSPPGLEPGPTSWLSILWQVHGRGTGLLSRLRAGDAVSATGPLGRPFAPPGRPGRAVIVAGGVGIPPFLLTVRALVATGREALVLLGARDAEHLFLADELRAAGAEVRVATEDGSRGTKGRVTVLLEDELKARAAETGAVYTCGPEPMMKAVVKLGRAHGVPGQASLERVMGCGFGVCFTCVCKLRAADGQFKNQRTCLAGPVVSFDDLPPDDAW